LYTMGYTLIMANEMRFSEVKRMLEAKGYRLDRIRGSHHVFIKAGVKNEIVPVHNGKVKPYYVREIQKL
jgi:predicted RNA binding protein YcfA (HicA-like mRNA interferase family)